LFLQESVKSKVKSVKSKSKAGSVLNFLLLEIIDPIQGPCSYRIVYKWNLLFNIRMNYNYFNIQNGRELVTRAGNSPNS